MNALLVFSRDAIRSLDRIAVERYRMPSIVLMENAAAGVAREALKMLRGKRGVTIVCGPGNNGGDGLAAARHLHNAGARVQVVLAAPRSRYGGDAAINLAIVRAMRIRVAGARARFESPDLIIDALFGTGLDRPVRGPMAALIDRINASGVPVLSVDIPSGLDADSGLPLGTAVRATRTVTLVGAKVGFAAARRYTGRVVVAGIGIPRELAESFASPVKAGRKRGAKPGRR